MFPKPSAYLIHVTARAQTQLMIMVSLSLSFKLNIVLQIRAELLKRATQSLFLYMNLDGRGK